MPSKQKINIFWFRRDLRLEDNTGLFHALTGERPVLPLFIFDSNILNDLENKKDTRLTFIYDEVSRLHQELLKKEGQLLVKKGMPLAVFRVLTVEFIVENVYINHDYEPYARARDQQLREFLNGKGIHFHTYKDQVIFEKEDFLSGSGESYKVFTPYGKKWLKELQKEDLPAPFPSEKVSNFLKIKDLSLFPSLEFLGFSRSHITIPSRNIPNQLIYMYDKKRDYPYEQGTSRLGIHLRHGTISIRRLVKIAAALNSTFLNELTWREFYIMILYHYPQVTHQAYKPLYDQIPWHNHEESFLKWCEGKTGIPLVDAGMRQLNQIGFMQNRLRMITASFLTKDLLIDWRWGEAYFAQHLLDYELASNNGGWKWAAGSGVDAQPYFRIFNPETQAKRFDPDLKFTKEWVPEFGTQEYPVPMVDLKISRQKAIEHFKKHLNG